MKTSDNLGLHLFEGTDHVSLKKINENTELLDREIPERILSEAQAVRAVMGDAQGRYRVLLKESHSLELGPYTGDPANCLGEPDALYDRLIAAPGTRFVGEYAYACEGKVAYKLNHRERKAAVLLDLTEKADTELDTVVCADEYHVYFARHANAGTDRLYNGYLEKYTHGGELVSSVLSATENEWTWNEYLGFAGDPTYCSLFEGDSYIDVRQTRDFIAVCCQTSVREAETYERHYMVYSFSKTDLAKVGSWDTGTVGAGEGREDATSFFFGASWPDNRLYASSGDTSVTLFCTDLAEPGVKTDLVTTGSSAYYPFLRGCLGDYALVYRDGEYMVYRFADLPALDGPATGLLSDVELMRRWYDPVNDKFTWYGAEYDPTADEAPEGKVWSLADGWSLPRFCCVDGLYHFKKDGVLYRDTGACYIIDRLKAE